MNATWPPEQIAEIVLKGQISFKSIYRFLYDSKISGGNLLFLKHKGRNKTPREKRGHHSMGIEKSYTRKLLQVSRVTRFYMSLACKGPARFTNLVC